MIRVVRDFGFVCAKYSFKIFEFALTFLSSVISILERVIWWQFRLSLFDCRYHCFVLISMKFVWYLGFMTAVFGFDFYTIIIKFVYYLFWIPIQETLTFYLLYIFDYNFLLNVVIWQFFMSTSSKNVFPIIKCDYKWIW